METRRLFFNNNNNNVMLLLLGALINDTDPDEDDDDIVLGLQLIYNNKPLPIRAFLHLQACQYTFLEFALVKSTKNHAI